MSEANGKNAILTKSQREFLQEDGAEPTSASGRMMRSRIKTRTVAAVQDMILLGEALSENDREDLRDRISNESAVKALEAFKDVTGTSVERSTEELREAAAEIILILEELDDA